MRIKELWRRRGVRIAIGVVAGAALASGYAATIGCASGGCPLTSDPTIAALYGAVLGGLALA